MKPLLLIGCGGHARSLIDLIESSPDWWIHGLVGLPQQVGSLVLGYPVLGSDADFPRLVDKCPSAILAIGQLPDSGSRERLSSELERYGFKSPALLSSHAIVSRHAQIGSGSTCAHGVIVNAGASVGNHCILNSRALIEHDVDIEDFCHISTGAVVNGGVRVGRGSFIGSGAMIREGLVLPPRTVIGAGKRVMGWPPRDQ